MKFLTRVEAFIDSTGDEEYMELTFVQRGFTGSGEARLAFAVAGAPARLAALAPIYAFCRAHEKAAPAVAGLEPSELLAASAVPYSGQPLSGGACAPAPRGALRRAGGLHQSVTTMY